MIRCLKDRDEVPSVEQRVKRVSRLTIRGLRTRSAFRVRLSEGTRSQTSNPILKAKNSRAKPSTILSVRIVLATRKTLVHAVNRPDLAGVLPPNSATSFPASASLRIPEVYGSPKLTTTASPSWDYTS